MEIGGCWYGKIHARGDALSDFASSMIWVGDCKTNFETFRTAVLMLSIQGWRPVARWVDPLPDGMVDLIFDPMHTRGFLFDSLSLKFRWNSTAQT